MNVSKAAFLAVAVVAACGADSKGPTPCGASIYLGPGWVDTGGIVVVGAGIYTVGWFDPSDPWDGSEVPGDDTSTPVGDDTSDVGSGDGTDPTVGDDTSGGDPSGGDPSGGGDTSGGGGVDAITPLKPDALTPATFSRDAHGCYECLVACATAASAAAPSQERVARGFSVYGHEEACTHAVGALERWAHRMVDAKLAACEEVDGASHSPAAPTIGTAAPSATTKGGVVYQPRATATPAEPGPVGAVK